MGFMPMMKTTITVLGLLCSTLCVQAFFEDLFFYDLFKAEIIGSGEYDDDDGAAPLSDLEEKILEVLRERNGDVYYLLFEGHNEEYEQAGVFIGEETANEILEAMNALSSNLPDDIDAANLETMIQDAKAVITFAG